MSFPANASCVRLGQANSPRPVISFQGEKESTCKAMHETELQPQKSLVERPEMKAHRLLADTRETLESTRHSIDSTMSTAEQTLKDMRAVLDRWERVKERFGQALDSHLQRTIDAMKDNAADSAPVGPPSGVTAHGLDGASTWLAPQRVVECNEVARPAMNTNILSHEYQEVLLVSGERWYVVGIKV